MEPKNKILGMDGARLGSAIGLDAETSITSVVNALLYVNRVCEAIGRNLGYGFGQSRNNFNRTLQVVVRIQRLVKIGLQGGTQCVTAGGGINGFYFVWKRIVENRLTFIFIFLLT